MIGKTSTKNNLLYNILKIVVLFIAFFLLSKFSNRSVDVHSLYMDDLQNYYYYVRSNFLQYTFSIYEGQVHYRPVSYGLLYLVFKIVSGHIHYINIVNNAIQAALAVLFYFFTRKLKVPSLICIATSLFYIITHFSYFQVGQAIGIIESSAMFLAFLNLYFVISYLDDNNPKDIIYMYISIFLLCFTHERYAAFFAVDFLAIILKKSEKSKLSKELILIAIAMLYVVVRYLALKSLIPIGTSKTDVVATFDIYRFFQFIFDEVKYVFGINAGPAYLSGINFNDVDRVFKNICYISIFFYIVIFIIYIYVKLIYDKSHEKNFSVDIVLAFSACLLIVSSSVTIRVEMRWIYSTYMIFVIYLAYMIYEISTFGLKQVFYISAFIYFSFFISRNILEMYYKNYYHNIFFFNDLRATNSLADQTILKYGKENFKDKKVYIFLNNFGIEGKSIYYFYEPFYDEVRVNDNDPVLNFVDNYEALVKLVNDDNNIVLYENYDTHTYEVFKIQDNNLE